MVHLILSSTKGNQGLRYFPFSGYLGLTPVRVEGVVRTKLDADSRLLQATSLTVSIRCYESRLGRVNILQSNVLVDHTQVLWSKADGVDYEAIGNLEYPFRLTLPRKIKGFSTAMFVDYRCMWRVEAVLNHVHISGVGSRQVKHFELPLVRYDLPAQIPLSRLPDPFLSQLTSKARAPQIRYSVDTPTCAIGPNDLVSVPIHLQPIDYNVSIRSASIVVERRIQFLDSSNVVPTNLPPTAGGPATNIPSQSPSPISTEFLSPSASSLFSHPQTAPHLDTSPVNRQGSSSTSSLSSSNPTVTPHSIYPSSASVASSTRPLLSPASAPPPTSPPTPLYSKIVVNTITEAETSGRFARDENGVLNKTMTLQWPAAKSHSRWAIGETIQSDLVSVRYFVRVKIVVQSPTGSDTLELDEKEIFVVSTNNAERQLAITKYNEMLDLAHQEYSSRSKSKSPRRIRGEREELPSSPLPSASSMPKASAAHMPGASLPTKSSSKGRSVTRRPHTSAGPRDKPPSSGPRLETSSYDDGRTRDDYVDVMPRGDLGKKRKPSEESKSERVRSEGKLRNGKSSFFSSAPKIGSTPSGSSTSTTASSSSISSSSHCESEREWEEQMAKVEVTSRRTSDILGFFLRKRPSTAVTTPRVALPGCNSS